MGSLFSAPKAPAPPPPPPPATIRDEIAGVEQVPVTQPDGTVTYVTRQLELTPEQKAEKEKFDTIMSDALAEIERLSGASYEADEQTQQTFADWRAEQEKSLNTSFSKRAEQEEALLARRGLADSSAAAAARRQRTLDAQDANQQLGREQRLLEDNVRNEKLALQQNLYNLASNRSDLDAAQKFQSAARGQSQLIGASQARQASLMQYYNQQLRASQQPSLFGQILPTIGGIAGAAFGGPAGASVGASLGSLFAGGR